MRVPNIIPCVCIDHKPTVADSVYYGMPQLKVSSWLGRQFYTVFCPNCGRGGCIEYRSSYLALKAWNKMMKEQWRWSGHPRYYELEED